MLIQDLSSMMMWGGGDLLRNQFVISVEIRHIFPRLLAA